MNRLRLDPAHTASGVSASERVYAPLVAAIVSGALPAGSLITEGEVAAELNVSRTPVREAFLLLEARGVLRLFPKKGAVVTPIDEHQVTDLLAVRIMLESAGARSVAPSAAEGIRGDLDRLIDEQVLAARTGDLLTFARADHRFHARIVEEAHNAIIDDFYTTLGPRLERMTHRVIARGAAELDGFIAEHRALADHLSSGRPHEFERALHDHIRTRHLD